MKYSEAKSRIKGLLESKYGDEWSDYYKIEEWGSSFVLSKLSKRDNVSKLFKVILWVSEEDPGCFEVCKLGRSEKPLAGIFMELALTPLEEREEEKKYVVKVWNRNDPLIIAEDHDTGSFSILPVSAVKDINGLADSPVYQATFTQTEINHMKDIISLNLDWDKAVEEYDGEI